MPKSNLQNSETSFQLASVLWNDIAKEIGDIGGAPASLILSDSNWTQHITLENKADFINGFSDISPDNKRAICFMGNDHIAIATAEGILRVLSINDNKVILEKKLGGHIEALTCSGEKMAVSLFPGSDELYYACGVKIYNIDYHYKCKKI